MRKVLSRLATVTIMLEAYSAANQQDTEIAEDMKYCSNSLREGMYLLVGEKISETFLSSIREMLKSGGPNENGDGLPM